MTEAAQVVVLVLVAALGAVVTATQEPIRQALASGLFGLTLTVAFLLLQAPGVAMAIAVVAGVAVPVMVLITVTNIRRGEE